MFDVPEGFLHRPFSRSEALASGLTRGVLQGPQFRRLYDGVYCHVSHPPTFADRIAAARLALPPGALTTGITRIQELGVDYGPRTPLHFVVEGDHHLAIDGIFLHRTVKLPPNDAGAATSEAAYVAYCRDARLIDAIKVGSTLLHRSRLDADLLQELLTEERWRRGVAETSYALPFLEGRCRSLPEAELLAYVLCSGLPTPEVNLTVELAPGAFVTPDLWFEVHVAAVEYEGSQHQEEREQYNADIDRYRLYRRNSVAYELITKERLRTPRTVVRMIHDMLVERGYEGPAPDFGPGWDALFLPLTGLLRRQQATSGVVSGE